MVMFEFEVMLKSKSLATIIKTLSTGVKSSRMRLISFYTKSMQIKISSQYLGGFFFHFFKGPLPGRAQQARPEFFIKRHFAQFQARIVVQFDERFFPKIA